MATNTKDKSTRQETSGSIVRRLMYGQVVSSDFIARNFLVLLAIMFMILTFISGKYTCMTKMEEVQRLTRELEVVNAERVRARSAYMGRIRESAMQELVDSLHLNLHVQECPPYNLSLEK